jgi:hypothetical protein
MCPCSRKNYNSGAEYSLSFGLGKPTMLEEERDRRTCPRSGPPQVG